MNWQQGIRDQIRTALPADSTLSVRGSAVDPRLLDGWSDLDLDVGLTADVDVGDLVPVGVWAAEDVRRDHGGGAGWGQTCRTVLTNGRRLDLSISGPGRLIGLHPAMDNDIRFLAATATAKLGRGDRLIGMHLTLELWQLCLVEAMQLRDRDTGSSIHRYGTDHDQLADEITALVAEPFRLHDRPTVIERTVELYATWRRDREPGYQPDWRPLQLLTDYGLTLSG